jgi:hypothetical protein
LRRHSSTTQHSLSQTALTHRHEHLQQTGWDLLLRTTDTNAVAAHPLHSTEHRP